MKRWVVLSLALMSVLVTATGQPRKQARQDVIWDVAHNRFVDQLDYWFEDGDFPRCVQLLRIMADLDPDDYDVATDLGWMLENIELDDEALAVYVRFRKDNPKDADAAFPEANYYFNQGLYAKVPSLLEGSLSMRPHPNSYRILAHAYEKMGQLGDCRRIWSTYLKVNPADETAKANLRRVEGKLSRSGR